MSGDIKELSVEELQEQLEHDKKIKELIEMRFQPNTQIILTKIKRRERFLSIINNEKDLFYELKKIILGLEKTSNKYDYSDIISSLLDVRGEDKSRDTDYDTLLIEQEKWINLMNYKEKYVYYINSTPKRVVMFDVRKLPEPTWLYELHNETTEFVKPGDEINKVWKWVGYYDVKTQSIDLTERLYKINEI